MHNVVNTEPILLEDAEPFILSFPYEMKTPKWLFIYETFHIDLLFDNTLAFNGNNFLKSFLLLKKIDSYKH